jgi:hypothetical protein
LRLLPDSYFLFWLYRSYLQYTKLVNKKVKIYGTTFRCFWKTPERSNTTNFFSIYLFSMFAFLFVFGKGNPKPEKTSVVHTVHLMMRKKGLPYRKYTQHNDRFSGKDRFVVFNYYLLQTILFVYTSFSFFEPFFSFIIT